MNADMKVIFKERLNVLMIEQGITQEEVASWIGKKRTALANSLSGDRQFLRIDDICIIADRLGTTLDYMLGRSDVKHESLKISDPYWQRATVIARHQRAKGISTYGTGIENNPMGIIGRLTYLEEELVDAIHYIEWAKDYITELEAKLGDDRK